MATSTGHHQSGVRSELGPLADERTRLASERRSPDALTTEEIWKALTKQSYAFLSYVTPAGEPRSSGVIDKAIGRQLYVAVAHDRWKAKHIRLNSHVAVVVPVRRGGLLSLVAPIPPATINFHGSAVVQRAGSQEARPVPKELASLIPAQRRASCSLITITRRASSSPTASVSHCGRR